MTTYTNTFGGQTIYPAQLPIRQVTLSADVTLEWPREMATSSSVVAWIMDVSASAGSLSITMPPANQTGNGQSILFNNTGANTFTVKDNAGNAILTVAAGIAWDLWLYDNSTVAGLWRSSQRGAAAASVNVAGLAGPGITTVGTTLGQSMPVVGVSADYTLGISDRAKFYIWTGGVGNMGLPAPATVGDNWFASIRNEGTGVVTVTGAAGNINGGGTLDLQPDDSATFASDGTDYYTAGLGQSATFAFDYIEIDVAGGGDYTLSGSQLNRIAYKLTGILTADRDIIVPATTQQYWINNATTGAFTLGVRTAGQASPGIIVATAEQAIMYCDGTNVVDGDSSGIATPVAIADGGTGSTTANGALVNLGGTATGIAVFTAASAATARTSLGSTTVGDAVFVAANAAAGRTALALGTMSTQDASAVAVTGGTLAGITSAAFTDPITLASTTATMTTWTHTDAGATAGPILDLYRISGTPAADDIIGQVLFNGRDSGGNKTEYASINGQVGVTTDGAEYGRLEIYNMQNGTRTFQGEFASGLVMAGAGDAPGVGAINATSLEISNVSILPSVSSGLTITLSATNTLTHGLGAAPSDFGAYLVAGVAPELGYTAGQRVNIGSLSDRSSSFTIPTVYANATTAYVTWGTTAPALLSLSTFAHVAIDITKWTVVLWARL